MSFRNGSLNKLDVFSISCNGRLTEFSTRESQRVFKEFL